MKENPAKGVVGLHTLKKIGRTGKHLDVMSLRSRFRIFACAVQLLASLILVTHACRKQDFLGLWECMEKRTRKAQRPVDDELCYMAAGVLA